MEQFLALKLYLHKTELFNIELFWYLNLYWYLAELELFE